MFSRVGPHKLNGSTYAHAILPTAELLAALHAESADRIAGAAAGL
ncbi:hypothetical protein Mnod_2729 [Methylobacterium nodulans ORS 2060]|uniref:Uncharacterized protein n=1 Tax=Methylobacterium nodulans (strain LMG 21967 / CNCM I-2342 / ORS 2060) TaxID=460265 RepID=B8IFF0_METNO|nr:hypothetical protein Mnod_2729 [Methylobacterium nodulans ORS 2060]